MNFLEFASAYFLGIFSQSISDDSKAIGECRVLFCELEEELRNLVERKPGGNINDAVNRIKTIEKILKKLNVYSASLFIGDSEFQKCIDLSLKRIFKWKSDQYAAQNSIASIKVELGHFFDLRNCYDESRKLERIRRKLNAGLIKRFFS